jgi:pimeloyl-ACP methyl ester carboxylesterase
MTTAPHSPDAIVADLLANSRRHETPCGEGHMVWHSWGSGPTVVLAHGAGGSWLHWVRNIEALAKHYTVLAMDVPGMGDSALPASPDHRGIADAVALGLGELLGPAQPVDFVGFSFGGVTSAHFAVYYPEWVRRLILIGTGGLATPKGEINLSGMRGLSPEQRVEANRANLLQLMLRHEASADALALYIQSTCGPKGRIVPAPLVLPDKLIQVLPDIRAQVDAIWGEQDRPHPDPAAQEAVLRKTHPDIDFRVIPEAGHWAMYERAETFNRTLLDMLATPLRTPTH